MNHKGSSGILNRSIQLPSAALFIAAAHHRLTSGELEVKCSPITYKKNRVYLYFQTKIFPN